MNRKFVAFVVFGFTVVSVCAVNADSESVSISITVANAPPQAFNNTVGPLNIDPEVQYAINAIVWDSNRLADLVTIVVKVYYGNSNAGNGRNYYTWTWTNPNPGTNPSVADFTNPANWSENVAGSFVSCANVIILLNRVVTFDLNWQLIGIARPTATNYWHYRIEATDTANPTAISAVGNASVNKFLSFTIETNSINFGNVNPGDALTEASDDTVNIMSNGEVDISVTGSDLTSGTDTIPVGQFYVEDEGAVQTVLTVSAQVIYNDYREVDEGGSPDPGILGYVDTATRGLDFGGSIPDPQSAGTYTGTWIIDVTNVCNPNN